MDVLINRQYTGKTSETIWLRAAKHILDYMKCQKIKPRPDRDLSSFMWDHTKEYYIDGLEPSENDFNFQVIKHFTDPMIKQLRESS